ncbi:MAG: pseudouridine synthase [Pirellulales bacterium]|nr:pseudouridine synthase [Pirellulales bacterium]
MRLQKVLASAGYGSRRACEELITEGRVEVDRQRAKLGMQVDPAKQKIYVDGELLKREKPVYYLIHKPDGYVTTNRDPQGRPRVIDLVDDDRRLFPVGRLDLHSEGLILVTNDGDLANRLAHPRYEVQKTYQVQVAGHVARDEMAEIRKGVFIAEGRTTVERIIIKRRYKNSTVVEMILAEGKNREIRRIFAAVGHKVQRLRRVAFGPLRLGEIPPGHYRMLTPPEVSKLRKILETRATPEKKGTRRRPKKKSARKPARGQTEAKKQPGKKAARKKTTRKKTSRKPTTATAGGRRQRSKGRSR